MRIAFFLFLACFSLTVRSQIIDFYSDTWAATDALGRKLPGYEQCGPPKENRAVGIFYFLWLGNHGNAGPFDISELIKRNPESPDFGPTGAFHHWGRPEIGYYRSDSDYAIIAHARLLSAAGVDTLIFDVTNAFTYTPTYMKLCGLYEWMRKTGEPTPQICFMTYTRSKETITKLYEEFYSKGLYPKLWFQWKGKPLILGDDKDLDPKIRDFFTIRSCWAWTYGQDKWNWLDHWPQRFAWNESAEVPEEVSACVAEHPTSNIGRSHFKGCQPEPDKYGLTPFTDKGPYFSLQIRRALELQPEFVFITGWNEWVAQRFIREENAGPEKMLDKVLKPGDSYFVDAYNQEFSRDIEPMEGGHTDDYYYQMADFIRRYKGVRPAPSAGGPKTIVIDGEFDDWADVQPQYRDSALDCIARDEDGFGQSGRIVNNTFRNNFVLFKAAADSNNVYFYTRCEKPISPHTGKNWMLLFIDADQNYSTGWEGYDLLVNSKIYDEKTASVMKSQKGWDWKEAGKVSFAVSGNQLELAVAYELVNPCGGKLSFQFHWADNMQKEDDIIEFAHSGDSAPERRFNYLFLQPDR